jgi:hypothetical protein
VSFAVGAVLVLFAALGVLLVGLGGYAFLQRCWLMTFGEHAVGTVVGLVADETSRTPDEAVTEMDLLPPMPHLRITFTDYFGASHEVTSDISVSPRKFRPGDNVPVVYRSGHPETFFVNRFWVKWGAPMLFIGLGLTLLICPVAFLGTVWPAFGDWAGHVVRQAAPWLAPIFVFGLPTMFVLLGATMISQRLRRLREDYRTQGTIAATGLETHWSVGAGGTEGEIPAAAGHGHREIWRWIRVAYSDRNGHKQTRTVPVATGLAARRRQKGQIIELLVDPEAPQDVLVNEAGELWFLPVMCVALGSIGLFVFTWAWLTDKWTF